MPGQVLAGDVYAVTQGSGAASVNTSLAENLTAQPWADLVSPEVLAAGTLLGQAVLLRAAEPDGFLALEEGRWVVPPTGDGVHAGAGLASRLGLRVGTFVALVGSTVPRIEVVRIAGIFEVPGAADDELLGDLALGRALTGLGPTSYHAIRVRTSDPEGLLGFLASFRASVHVAGPGIDRADVNSDPPTPGDRLVNLLLRSGRGPVPRDYLASAASEAANSVRVVAIGLAGLIGALVALAVHSVQARAYADRSTTVGVLRAMGATDRWMRARAALEALPLAAAAGILGGAIGFAVHVGLRPASSVVLFGHEVRAVFDPATFAFVVAAIVLACLASTAILVEASLRARPSESIREGHAREAPPSLEVVLRG